MVSEKFKFQGLNILVVSEPGIIGKAMQDEYIEADFVLCIKDGRVLKNRAGNPSPDPASPKPTLGLILQSHWQRVSKLERRAEIFAAMRRYIANGQHIPKEWLEELMELIDVV